MTETKDKMIEALERILHVPFIIAKKSSRIYAMGYIPKKMQLIVVFQKNRSIYTYANIPETVWDKLEPLLKNPIQSLGTTFQELVLKPQYPYIKCELTLSTAKKKKLEK